jgi:ketosteroid isomerase-like protein
MRTNVKVATAMVNAVRCQDAHAFAGFCTPDVIWEENTGLFPGLPALSRGQAELREWFREAIVETWTKVEMSSTFEEVGDDCLLANHEVRAIGRSSGVKTRLQFWEVAWFRDGKVRRRRLFTDETEARADAKSEPAAPD